MRVFIIPKENLNVSFLPGLPWLWSVDIKFFIQKKEIHIKDIKKKETVSQIFYLTTLFEGTRFQASRKDKVVIDKSFEGKDIKNDIEDSFFEEESDEKPFDQDF